MHQLRLSEVAAGALHPLCYNIENHVKSLIKCEALQTVSVASFTSRSTRVQARMFWLGAKATTVPAWYSMQDGA